MGNCLSILCERAIGSWYDVEESGGRVRPRFFLWGRNPLYETDSTEECCWPWTACNSSDYLSHRVLSVIKNDVRRIQEQLDIMSWKTLPPRDVVVALSEQFESGTQSTNLVTHDQIDDMCADTLYRELPPRLVVFHILVYLEFGFLGLDNPGGEFWIDNDRLVRVRYPLDTWGYFSRDITRHPFFLAHSLDVKTVDIKPADFCRFLPYIWPVSNLSICGPEIIIDMAHIYQRCRYLERLDLNNFCITMDNVAEFGVWLDTGTIRALDVSLRFHDTIVLEAMKHLSKCCTDRLRLLIPMHRSYLMFCLTFRESRLAHMKIMVVGWHGRFDPSSYIAYRPPFDKAFALLGVPDTVEYKDWLPSPEERHVCDMNRVMIIEDTESTTSFQ